MRGKDGRGEGKKEGKGEEGRGGKGKKGREGMTGPPDFKTWMRLWT